MVYNEVMMVRLYGIPNCNTVKKARNWLLNNNIAYEFHDLRKMVITDEQLGKWCEVFYWEKLLNRQGMTWRKLDTSVKNQVVDQNSAINLMQQKPTIIKRPILEADNDMLLGFDEAEYERFLQKYMQNAQFVDYGYNIATAK